MFSLQIIGEEKREFGERSTPPLRCARQSTPFANVLILFFYTTAYVLWLKCLRNARSSCGQQ